MEFSAHADALSLIGDIANGAMRLHRHCGCKRERKRLSGTKTEPLRFYHPSLPIHRVRFMRQRGRRLRG